MWTSCAWAYIWQQGELYCPLSAKKFPSLVTYGCKSAWSTLHHLTIVISLTVDGDLQFEAGCLFSRLRKWHCYSLTIVALLGMPGSSMTFMSADFWDLVEQGIYKHYVHSNYCAQWPGMHFCHISDFSEFISYWCMFLSVDLQNPQNYLVIIICHWHHLSWVSHGIPKPCWRYSWDIAFCHCIVSLCAYLAKSYTEPCINSLLNLWHLGTPIAENKICYVKQTGASCAVYTVITNFENNSLSIPCFTSSHRWRLSQVLHIWWLRKFLNLLRTAELTSNPTI